MNYKPLDKFQENTSLVRPIFNQQKANSPSSSKLLLEPRLKHVPPRIAWSHSAQYKSIILFWYIRASISSIPVIKFFFLLNRRFSVLHKQLCRSSASSSLPTRRLYYRATFFYFACASYISCLLNSNMASLSSALRKRILSSSTKSSDFRSNFLRHFMIWRNSHSFF